MYVNSGDEKVVLVPQPNVSSVGTVNASKYIENKPHYRSCHKISSSIPILNVYIRFPTCEGENFRTFIHKKLVTRFFLQYLKVTNFNTRAGKIKYDIKVSWKLLLEN